MKAVWRALAGEASTEWEYVATQGPARRAARAPESKKKSDSFNRRVIRAMTIASASSESIVRCRRQTADANSARSIAAKFEKDRNWFELVHIRAVSTDVVQVCSAGFLSVRALQARAFQRRLATASELGRTARAPLFFFPRSARFPCRPQAAATDLPCPPRPIGSACT